MVSGARSVCEKKEGARLPVVMQESWRQRNASEAAFEMHPRMTRGVTFLVECRTLNGSIGGDLTP